MCLKSRVQIDVCDYLSIDDNKCVVAEKIASVVERTTCTENYRLFNVGKFHAKCTAISQGGANRLRSMMEIDDNLVQTILDQVFSDVADEWFTEDGNGRLGPIFC